MSMESKLYLLATEAKVCSLLFISVLFTTLKCRAGLCATTEPSGTSAAVVAWVNPLVLPRGV